MNWFMYIFIIRVTIGEVLPELMCLSNCSCEKLIDEKKRPLIGVFQVNCYSYTVKASWVVDSGLNFYRIEINCHSNQTQQWRRNFNQIDIEYVNFSKCQLSDTSIHQTMSTLGINEVNEIAFDEIRFNGSLENFYLSYLNTVKKLFFSITKITLTNGSFEGTPLLTHLFLRENDIQEIPKGVFKQLTLLKVLDLGKNKILNLDNYLFDDFPLTHLYLDSNNLTSLNLNIQHLELLDVRNNRLSNFEPESLNVPKLKSLYLSHNNISNLTSNNLFSLQYLTEVEIIDLSNNYINCIDQGWLNLTKLYSVNLSRNNFTVLRSREIQNFFKIKNVYLSSNPLERIDLSDLETFIENQPPSHLRKILINLSSDKFICDCRNYFFARFFHHQMPPNVYDYLIIKENLICNDDLRTEFSNVNLDSLTLCDWNIFEDVDKTDCTGECECTYRPHDNSGFMNCANRNLTLAPEKIISSRNLNYTELNLRNNSITKLPNYENVNIKKLNLGYNNLKTINITQLPKNLMVLYLDYSNVTMISEMNDSNNTLTNLTMLTMSNNPWTCDCAAKNTFNFIQKYLSKIIDLPNVTCHQSSTMVHTMNTEKLCDEKSNTATIIIVTAVSLLFSLLVACVLAILYNNYGVKSWLYSHNVTWLISKGFLDQHKRYDAFLSFSHQDVNLVADHLLPGLEQGNPPFKVCIHYRDWVLGDPILDQIARSVEESRFTIIVMSQHFLDSVWGQTEFRMAYTNAVNERQSRIIVILSGDVSTINLDLELKTYLSMNTFIKWGDLWFWDKLRYALRQGPATKTKKTGNSLCCTLGGGVDLGLE